MNPPQKIGDGLNLAETVAALKREHNRLVELVARQKPVGGLGIDLQETSSGTVITNKGNLGNGTSAEPRWL